MSRLAPIVVERDGRFVVEWHEDGKWWVCRHKHRDLMRAEECARKIRRASAVGAL